MAGRITPERAEWFGDLTLTPKHVKEDQVITVFSGPVVDQAALFGILSRIRDLGLKLISVNLIDPGVESGADDDLQDSGSALNNTTGVSSQ